MIPDNLYTAISVTTTGNYTVWQTTTTYDFFFDVTFAQNSSSLLSQYISSLLPSLHRAHLFFFFPSCIWFSFLYILPRRWTSSVDLTVWWNHHCSSCVCTQTLADINCHGREFFSRGNWSLPKIIFCKL